MKKVDKKPATKKSRQLVAVQSEKYFDIPGKMTAVSLELPNGLEYDEWEQIIFKVAQIHDASNFWIGDALNYGNKAYGERYAQAVDERQAAVWMQYAYVARSVQISIRIEILFWSYHQLVAPLEPDKQRYWLKQAIENDWTVRELREAIREAMKLPTPPLPEGKYRVIYADPPWKYSDELIEGYGAATHHYPPMSIEELGALEIKDLASDNAVLFIWTTSPMLDETFKVIEAWGFDYKTSFVWDKVKHNYGHYNSVRHEFLLVCVRGSCIPDNKELHDSVIEIERTEIHSEKPPYFRELIDQMYVSSEGRPDRIELFARGNVPDHWHRWGNE